MAQSFSIENTIRAFAALGDLLGKTALELAEGHPDAASEFPELHHALHTAVHHNAWFTGENIARSFSAWSQVLTQENLQEWISAYASPRKERSARKVAVIMAGNIPLVGFHDFLCTLVSGHFFAGKLSSDDDVLMPALASVLCGIEPSLSERIHFTSEPIRDIEAVIATGSNNSARYFEYYFSKYPHIIRRNRNGVAVLTGTESTETLHALGLDISSYFGLGCRSVSKVFIPQNTDPEILFKAVEPYAERLLQHNKYMNNYFYQRSLCLLGNTPFRENGFYILQESSAYSSPIPVLYFEYYSDIQELQDRLAAENDQIQCVVTEAFQSTNTVLPGQSQFPALHDYADGIDTLKFLLEL
jgi:hypothetical protein